MSSPILVRKTSACSGAALGLQPDAGHLRGPVGLPGVQRGLGRLERELGRGPLGPGRGELGLQLGPLLGQVVLPLDRGLGLLQEFGQVDARFRRRFADLVHGAGDRLALRRRGRLSAARRLGGPPPPSQNSRTTSSRRRSQARSSTGVRASASIPRGSTRAFQSRSRPATTVIDATALPFDRPTPVSMLIELRQPLRLAGDAVGLASQAIGLRIGALEALFVGGG